MMIYQRPLLEFIVVRSSPPGLSSCIPEFNPPAVLCLISVWLEQVLKEQGMALEPFANVILFYFIFKINTFA